MELNWLKVDRWLDCDGLLHGFLGRKGGKSTGPYSGLNLSYRVADDHKIVSQNVCDMKLEVGIHDGRIVTMKQVHGDYVLEVADPKIKEAGECDGMITEKPGIFLGVLTADCVPILLLARNKRKVGAVHAGWRGTVAGIAANGVSALKEKYGVQSDSIEAALGPAIGPCCYEVGEEVAQAALARWGEAAEAFIDRTRAKPHLDLRGLNRAILQRAGVPTEQIYEVGPCTSCSGEEFFSYRRARAETGRQMSFIGWT